METSPDRRSFLKAAAGGIAGLGLAVRDREAEAAAPKSRVAVVRNPKAITERNECNRRQAARMIDRALLDLTGKGDAKAAWTALGVGKDDVVGIKINCNGAGFPLYAHTELVYALTESLSGVVRPESIIIYDRSGGELSRAGFRVNRDGSGVRCMGTEDGGGFHPREGLTKIVTDTCTKLINLPSLKTFGGEFSGSLFLKNHIGTLPREDMSRCHGNAGFCTEVVSRPSIKAKTVLALCDGLRGTWNRSEPWYWGGIIASRDQVAAEYTALQIINEKRRQEGETAFETPSYVVQAESSGIGTCTPARIETVRAEL